MAVKGVFFSRTGNRLVKFLRWLSACNHHACTCLALSVVIMTVGVGKHCPSRKMTYQVLLVHDQLLLYYVLHLWKDISVEYRQKDCMEYTVCRYCTYMLYVLFIVMKLHYMHSNLNYDL